MRILIAEDENFFSVALSNVLTADGHSVSRAENGKIAREWLEREDFDCVISDAQMPLMSGPELAQWIRLNKPTPFILMAGFAEQADPQAPFGLRGATLLIKPFQAGEVRQALTATLKTLNVNPRESYEALIPVPRGSVRDGSISDFSLYHYVDGRPQPLLPRGQTVLFATLRIAPETKLYTDRESLSHVLATGLALGKGAAANPAIEPARRSLILQNAVQLLNEQAAMIGIEAAAAEVAVEMITTYLKAINDRTVWETIAGLDIFSRPVYAQTLAVMMICVLMAQEQRFSIQDTFKLTTAALFHDLGQTALDPILIKTPRVLLTMKDRQQLEKHVELGVALLQKSGWVSTEVCTIIWQHHENDSGNGYPKGLKHQQIHPMARLLRVADEFCLSVMKTAGHPGIPPHRAIDTLKDKRELDPKFVIALQRVLTASTAKQTV